MNNKLIELLVNLRDFNNNIIQQLEEDIQTGKFDINPNLLISLSQFYC